MTVLILHLSDIHIDRSDDHILSKAEKIAACTYVHLPTANHVVILVSGDIAQSGRQSQYLLAEQFIEKIKASIASQCQVPVTVLVAPGNHDCNFDGDQEARNVIAAAAAKKGPSVPPSYVELATAVQDEYAAFKKRISPAARRGDKLWETYEIDVAGKVIAFDALNASWLSTRHEQQGNLYYPYENYEVEARVNAAPDLRVAILHHPFSWFSQTNVQKFRSFMHGLEDFIFTGHEHYANARSSDEVWTGGCNYIEGAVLQQRNDPTESGFNVVLFNIDDSTFLFETYRLSGSGYSRQKTSAEWADYRNLKSKATSELPFTPEWEECLSDVGATLKHPSGQKVALQDIYVYPDLDSRAQRHEKESKTRLGKISAKTLNDLKKPGLDVIIEGAENAGKTRLLYVLLQKAHVNGALPLFIKGAALRSGADSEIRKLIRGAVIAQYGAAAEEPYNQSDFASKILYLDDLDGSPLNTQTSSAVFRKLRKHFSRAFITVGENYQLAELFGETNVEPDAEEELAEHKTEHYRISPLGYQRRAELVEKWNSIGANGTEDNNALLATCDEAERLIESARIQHVASTVPIFVLSLLQATASGATKELLKSSFAHYYYFLVIGAFEKGGVKPNEMEAYMAAATHLSWFIKSYGDQQRISVTQFNEFVAVYSADWTQTDERELLEVLLASRLLEQDADSLYFTYPYAYYYFLGRFASISDQEEVQDYIIYCMRNLYVRECANTILFLAHHTSNSKVLDHVVVSLNEHFPALKPVTLSKEDVKSVAKLISYAPDVSYQAQNPKDYRRKQALAKDSRDDGRDDLAEAPNAADQPKNSVQELISLFKSVEVAGALLTHQFPNYSRVKKAEAIRAVFDGSLRAIRMFFDVFEKDTAGLSKALSHKFQSGDKELTREDAEAITRTAIGLLLRFISTIFITKAGMHLSSKEISNNVSDVMGTSPTCAYRLIKLSQELQRPGRLPRLEITRLTRDEADNACVMGVLQLLVTQRLYMYETDYDDKDWAVSAFRLNGQKNAIEMKHQKGPGTRRWAYHG